MELLERHPINHYRRKAQRYGRTLRFIGLRVDEETRERWADLIRLGRMIDTYIDTPSDIPLIDRSTLVFRFLADPDRVAHVAPKIAPAVLGNSVHSTLRNTSAAILACNILIKNTKNKDEYIQLRRREGRKYAQLITSVATPAVVEQPSFALFERWLPKIGESTNLINSAHGIGADHRSGELGLEPSISLRLKLLGSAVVCLLPGATPDQNDQIVR